MPQTLTRQLHLVFARQQSTGTVPKTVPHTVSPPAHANCRVIYSNNDVILELKIAVKGPNGGYG